MNDDLRGIREQADRVKKRPYPNKCIYAPYEPKESGYFHWTAQWPTEDLDCGYPLHEGVEWIELTNNQYGNVNNHNTTALIDGHIFIAHNNHKYALENLSGQRVLGWIYSLESSWKRSSFNPNQKGEPLELFPPPDVVNERKFDGNCRYCGNAKVLKLNDGTIITFAGVFIITPGNEFDPKGRANQWHTICMLARTVTPQGDLGTIKIIECDDHGRLKLAQQDGFLQYEEVYDDPWLAELNLEKRAREGKKLKASNGLVVCEIYRHTLDADANTAIAFGRGENAQGNFRCYTSLSYDGGETWEMFQPTNIPNGENTVALFKLPDGRWAILGTLGDRWQRERRPFVMNNTCISQGLLRATRITPILIAVVANILFCVFLWTVCRNNLRDDFYL